MLGLRPRTFNCQLEKVKRQIGYTFYIVNSESVNVYNGNIHVNSESVNVYNGNVHVYSESVNVYNGNIHVYSESVNMYSWSNNKSSSCSPDWIQGYSYSYINCILHLLQPPVNIPHTHLHRTNRPWRWIVLKTVYGDSS